MSKLYELLYSHFKDHDKVHQWYKARNPNFNDISPIDMIANGHRNKVELFVELALFNPLFADMVKKKVA